MCAVPRSSKNWYVAQVKTRRETLAISHLERQGFDAFCPLVARSRMIRKRSTTVREPLFPGYVFVRAASTTGHWRSVNGTIGVIRLVTFGDAPAFVAPGFVERMREFALSDFTASFDDNLQAGDAVRILGGPFDDLCGSLVSKKGSERVIVLLRLLSGEMPVELQRSSLIAA